MKKYMICTKDETGPKPPCTIHTWSIRKYCLTLCLTICDTARMAYILEENNFRRYTKNNEDDNYICVLKTFGFSRFFLYIFSCKFSNQTGRALLLQDTKQHTYYRYIEEDFRNDNNPPARTGEWEGPEMPEHNADLYRCFIDNYDQHTNPPNEWRTKTRLHINLRLFSLSLFLRSQII